MNLESILGSARCRKILEMHDMHKKDIRQLNEKEFSTYLLMQRWHFRNFLLHYDFHDEFFTRFSRMGFACVCVRLFSSSFNFLSKIAQLGTIKQLFSD
jgi:hypothetical protein